MTLRTLTPAAGGDPGDNDGAVRALASLGEDIRIRVWCDDGCADCQALLPAFAAALETAAVPNEHVVEYAVERLPEGRKRGPKVEEYRIERIPTVVVERDGVEIARFVEGDEGPIAEALAGQLAEADVTG